MALFYIGLGVSGLLMSLSASGIISHVRKKLRKNTLGKRTGPRVNTTIRVQKENKNAS